MRPLAGGWQLPAAVFPAGFPAHDISENSGAALERQSSPWLLEHHDRIDSVDTISTSRLGDLRSLALTS
jgi:hypothetical protein